jgi:hypothetical protein
LDLLRTDSSWYADYYYINLTLRSLPNWFSHLAIAGLMRFFPPLLAEKAFLMALVILYAIGVRRLSSAVGEKHAWTAYLALPLFYNWTFQKGFYNFCFSLVTFCFALAYWLRHQSAFSLRQSIVLGLLVLACYFMHPFSTLVLLASLCFLSIITVRARTVRESVFHFVALAPAGILLSAFIASGESSSWVVDLPSTEAAFERARYFLQNEFIRPYETRWIAVASGISLAAFGAAIAATLMVDYVSQGGIRCVRRVANPLLLTGVLLLLLYLSVPGSFAGGAYIYQRLPIFVFLVLLPWVSPRIPSLLRNTIIAACVLATAIQTVAIAERYRQHQFIIEESLAGISAIPPKSRILPLIFDPRLAPTGEKVRGLRHMHAYYCLAVPCISWGNYEADREYFPIRFRDGIVRPPVKVLESREINLDLSKYTNSSDFVLVWQMPDSWRHREDLGRRYSLILSQGRLQILRRSLPH